MVVHVSSDNIVDYFLYCFLNKARGLSGNYGNIFSISSRLSIARSNLMNEANVIPVEDPFSKELMVNTLNPDFSETSFWVCPIRLR